MKQYCEEITVQFQRIQKIHYTVSDKQIMINSSPNQKSNNSLSYKNRRKELNDLVHDFQILSKSFDESNLSSSEIKQINFQQDDIEYKSYTSSLLMELNDLEKELEDLEQLLIIHAHDKDQHIIETIILKVDITKRSISFLKKRAHALINQKPDI